MKKFFHLLGSLKLTVPLLAASMLLVFFATLDQVHWGVHLVQKKYFECLFCAYPIDPGASFRLPMPGGFLLGGLLLANLVAAHFRHFRAQWNKAGIAITHLGVLLLIASGFSTAALQRDGMTVIPEGGSADYYSDFNACELALTDTGFPDKDRTTVVPEPLLRESSPEKNFAVPGTATELRVRKFWPNARIVPPVMARNFPGLSPVKVDNGVGARAPLVLAPSGEDFSPNGRNSPSAVVEVLDAGRSLGTWLVNVDLAGSPFGAQTLTLAGRPHTIALRMKRSYFPFALRLEKFTHEKHPGTEIPKNFASDVTLLDPREGAPRAVTISMNQPLRHDGLTFYQASFDVAKNGAATTALQTVRNPSYILPYLSVALVGVGMIVQFGISLGRFIGKRKETV